MHDLQHVALLQGGCRVLSPGYDAPIALYGNGPLGYPEQGQQALHGRSLRYLVGVAIDFDLHAAQLSSPYARVRGTPGWPRGFQMRRTRGAPALDLAALGG